MEKLWTLPQCPQNVSIIISTMDLMLLSATLPRLALHFQGPIYLIQHLQLHRLNWSSQRSSYMGTSRARIHSTAIGAVVGLSTLMHMAIP